eukprot:92425-Pyramimonas_sp.AAC.1
MLGSRIRCTPRVLPGEVILIMHIQRPSLPHGVLLALESAGPRPRCKKVRLREALTTLVVPHLECEEPMGWQSRSAIGVDHVEAGS